MTGQHCDSCNRWLPNGREYMWCAGCWPFDEPYPTGDRETPKVPKVPASS